MLAELTNWPEYVTIFVGLMALTVLPVMVPIFLTLFVGRSNAELRSAALMAGVGFFVATSIFAIFGEVLLHAFGISLGAFQMAGGLLLIMTAIDFLRMDPSALRKNADASDASIVSTALVPFTIPLLAGPGVLSAVVLFGAEHDESAHKTLVLITLALYSVLIALVFMSAAYLQRIITDSVTLVFLRVMGLIVAAIAFEFLLHGLAAHFPQIEIGGH